MRLVLGDDHVMFLHALRDGLVRRGHDVVGSYGRLDDLAEAVERDRPDLCVLDVDFGGRSVLDAVAVIRVRNPDVALVLLAGGAPADVWVAFEQGLVDGVVNKLCDISALNRVLERVLAGDKVVERFRRPVPDLIAAGLSALGAREQEVMRLLAEGASTAEMAVSLGLSQQATRTVTRRVLRTLGVSSRNKAARLAVGLDELRETVDVRAG